MKKLKKQGRHGDVFIQKICDLPKGAKLQNRDGGRVILAYGEVTGHAHAIEEENCEKWALADEEYLIVTGDEPVNLRHEEHDTQVIAPGTYEIIHQFEEKREEIKKVVD